MPDSRDIHRGVELLAELRELINSFPPEDRKRILESLRHVLPQLPQHCSCFAHAAGNGQ
jgi:hypothetical protein